MFGVAWGLVVATAAAAGLLVLQGVLARGYRVAHDAAGFAHGEYVRLAGEYEQCREALRRQVAEACQREEAHRSMLASRAVGLQAAAGQVASAVVPAALNGDPLPPVPQEASTGNGEAGAVFGPVAVAVAEGAARLRERLDERAESSRLAVVALARRVQASAHRIQEEATAMAERHPGDADVLESSMRVDHAAAQQARHAQSVAVLCGEWPAQQWPEPLALVDVVRAAAGRIVPFTRVSVLGDPDVAAAAGVVEPLIHLVAELLANATQSSPPATQVQVGVRVVQRGAVIEIDDGGVGMDEHRLEAAREVASGRRPVGLGELGEIPQTGLAVAGQYARRHRLRVDLVPSAYCGVRVVVLMPGEVTEILEPAGARPAADLASGPTAQDAASTPPPSAGALLAASETLPQRHSRRRETSPAADQLAAGASQPGSGQARGPAPGADEPAPPQPDEQSPAQAGAWMSAFLDGHHDGDGAEADPPADTGLPASEQRRRQS